MTPDELVAAAQADYHVRNGVPDAATAAARARAAEVLREVLGPSLGALDGSPLGTPWTEEFRATAPPPAPALDRLGWLPLDPLFARLGIGGRGRWLVRERGEVLGAVRFGDPSDADPVGRVLDRAERRGEVRLTDVLELRRLRELGARFPSSSPVLTAAADIEVGLGSRELIRWASGRRPAAPVDLGGGRGRRLVVAASGVDGAGKSTLLDALRCDLDRCGVPVARVWLRPGMGLGRLVGLAARVKRRRGDDAAPSIALISADPERVVAARTGAIGWLWSMLVTVAFLVGVRRQHAAARGVVLYDRHLVDALATLEFAYAGADLRAQRWLVRRFLPKADLAFFLELPAEEAVRRKQGDPIGERAVRRQLDAYAEWLPRVPALARLDATRPASEVRAEALERVLAISR